MIFPASPCEPRLGFRGKEKLVEGLDIVTSQKLQRFPKSIWQVVDKVIDLIGLINLPLISTEVLVVVEISEQSGESVDVVLPVLRQLPLQTGLPNQDPNLNPDNS